MSCRNQMFRAGAVVGVLALASAWAFAQVQSDDQQKCLNGINKAGAGVSKAQGKENVRCLKEKGKGTLIGTAQACLTADAKLKVQKKKDKTTKVQTNDCGTAPDFGFAGATAVNDAAVQAEVDLTGDVYGPDLDAATISCSSSADGCACQQKISKDVEKLVATKLKEFLKCKKAALDAGAASEADLEDCIDDAGTPGSIAADTNDKVAKTVSKIKVDITKKCDDKGVTAGAFPGDCDTLSGAALGDCLDVLVECRVCQMLNEMDDLFVNCDLFDDGAANMSCESGTGPTPTPTLSPTPTPSPTSTALFQGAIARTSGAWNYDAVQGLPGGELECDDHFPGTHVCTFAELETSEAAGELVGITDVNTLPVVHFWAVIPESDPFDQCISTVGSIRWFYSTVHTGSMGEHAALNNGTGVLDPVQPPVSCAGNMFSVGCCKDP